MNQLLWYFASLESDKCYHLDGQTPDFEHNDKACTIWRRFAKYVFSFSLNYRQKQRKTNACNSPSRSIFETSQSLFWASFGLVDLTAFDLTGIKSFTRFWALLVFGCYSVINIIVLLNMLIAMMSNSYQIISVTFVTPRVTVLAEILFSSTPKNNAGTIGRRMEIREE